MAKRENEINSASSLHEELKIPRQYLRQLLTGLAKSGFIVSTSGRKGVIGIFSPAKLKTKDLVVQGSD